MRLLLMTVCLISTKLASGGSVGAQSACPTSPLETCRWSIEARVTQGAGRPTVHVDWEKSIVSRHWEESDTGRLACNLDRGFNFAGGGYIRVWFQGEAQPCDPTRRNPADCGVTFLLASPTDLISARGFVVTAPEGKTLVKVEHYSTLNLRCGDLGGNADRLKWNSRIGWRSDLPADGIYTENSIPTKE